MPLSVPTDLHPTASVDSAQLWHAVRAFVQWVERTGGTSYDPYDLWGTVYGLLARRLYYAKNPLGLLLISPVVLLETLGPGARGLFVKKQRFATADAQLGLAFLNLDKLTGQSTYLDQARAQGEHLLQSSIPGYSGHAWGYPFDWQNSRSLWRKNTPFITAVPYCFECFLGLYDTTQDQHCLEIAASAARFVFADLKDTETSRTAAASSYSPVDHSKVVNASAYRAFVLFEAAHRFNRADYQARAWQNLNFVLETQRADGAWLYAVDHPAEQFIDHFHTCFVLKNLVKINQRLGNEAVRRAIERGYAYYRRNLFDAKGLPRSFALQPRTQIVRLEMYNVAEAITLGTLLRSQIPEAFDLAQNLARATVSTYQTPAGCFVTRVYLGGLRHTLPFLRWPQAQMFYALTNFLAELDRAPLDRASSLTTV